MATASPSRGDAASRASIAKTTPDNAVTQAQPSVAVAAPTRREFLNYIWIASMALMTGQFTALTLWLAFPRFKEGEFGGLFPVDPGDLPAAGDAPLSIPSGRFHVSNTEAGLLILYGVCTHLGCLPKWNSTNVRFECPCHGSKYRANGTYIEGPAPRGLDRFPVQIIYADGTTVETDAGADPVALIPDKEIAEIKVNTGRKLTGPARGTI
jgi:cytochrome b6-f complex iron-sulfur subunit